MTVVVDPSRLTAFGADVLSASVSRRDDAELVSDSLVTADLWGHPSHGMLRLPWYAARLRSGAMTAVTAPEIVTDPGRSPSWTAGTASVRSITDRPAPRPSREPRDHGIGVVAVRNSNHFGTAAYWTRRMADAGCVGILTTNGSPAMAPWGGNEKTVGANPWSVATPGAATARSSSTSPTPASPAARSTPPPQRGEQIPTPGPSTQTGVPTTDPHVAVHGLLAPMGGHKGYGISFMMDVLSGVLTGSGTPPTSSGPTSRPAQPLRAPRARPAHRRRPPRAEFARRIDDLIATTKAVPRAAGVEEIFYPGEIEARAEVAGRDRRRPLPDQTRGRSARARRLVRRRLRPDRCWRR